MKKIMGALTILLVVLMGCEVGAAIGSSADDATVESKVTNNDGTFKDYFNGYSTGTISQSYYSSISGTWKVVDVDGNYKLQESSGSSTGLFIQDEINTDDATVIAKVKSQSSTTDAGIMARYKNSSNYYTMFLDDGQIKLKRKVSGSWKTLDSASFSYSTSTTYTLKMILDGSSIKGYVNDTLYVEATDSSLSSGYFGLRTYKNKAYFDAFQIYYDGSGSDDNSGSSYPTQVLGITEKTWKINSFVGSPSSDPTYYDDITDAGVDYDTYSDSNYFYTDGEWTYFKCYRGLGGSSNSDNPRVELRELDGSGNLEYWTNEGTNSMEWTVRVDQLSRDADGDEGVTCFGQIHGPGDSVDDIIRVQFKGEDAQTSGSVQLKISGYITEDVMGGSQILDDTYYLDKEYTFKITYNSDDYVKLYCDGSLIFSQKMDTDKDDNYFKVGNYVQQSKDTSYDGSSAIVAVKDLTVIHN